MSNMEPIKKEFYGTRDEEMKKIYIEFKKQVRNIVSDGSYNDYVQKYNTLLYAYHEEYHRLSKMDFRD